MYCTVLRPSRHSFHFILFLFFQLFCEKGRFPFLIPSFNLLTRGVFLVYRISQIPSQILIFSTFGAQFHFFPDYIVKGIF